jgi:hypothetical protein
VSDEKDKKDDRGKLTARDLLQAAAGDDHWHCTVVSKSPVHRGAIRFTCLCGDTYEVVATTDNTDALRNVQLEETAKKVKAT